MGGGFVYLPLLELVEETGFTLETLRQAQCPNISLFLNTILAILVRHRWL